ncbi:MAG: ribonuclease HII [Candidatus Calescibacterium sp.]|nr:ribonuclease HII [Candidatus Calescibacterium sp.]MCX7972200.1 ribonuclease HII [bacterium]MDW8194890.1 ribonuclease HII [Candidatus Calescibacterium sp.]
MWICGIDETGRGALAGPLCVAAFCSQKIPEFYTNDSKKLTPKTRKQIFKQIVEFVNNNKYTALIYIVFIPNHIIDKINILNANLLGFKIVIEKIEKRIGQKPDIIYIDGDKKPDMQNYNIITQVKADSKIKVVQIASIIAKVTRDKLMDHLAKKYPYYNFHNNKGYYDIYHAESIIRHGICPLHRKTFVKNLLQAKLFH